MSLEMREIVERRSQTECLGYGFGFDSLVAARKYSSNLL